jgi:NADH:ubiquinone oxidoreductase subunit
MAATIGTRIHTLLTGRFVGQDEFGNRYYESRGGLAKGARRRRWVIYNGVAEASKVPPHWHGWLHHTLDAPVAAHTHAWQQPHRPNLTGTTGRYVPQGHITKGSRRAANSSDYQPWTPK